MYAGPAPAQHTHTHHVQIYISTYIESGERVTFLHQIK